MVGRLKLRIREGKNILLVGDLEIKVIDGLVEVFGAEFKSGDTISIERLTSAPLIAIEDSDIEVEFGEEGYISESRIKLIPEEWKKAVEKIKELPKGSKIFVCANVDAGKSGFICYLANKIVAENKRIAIIGADTGQSEMNPPTTIGLAFVEKPIIHLSNLEYTSAWFVGSTSPAGMLQRSIVGVIKMVNEAIKKDPDMIIINTTGWVHGAGRELKETKIIAVDPDFVVILEKEVGELSYIYRLLEKIGKKYIVIPAAPKLKSRSRAERRILRSIYYEREFRNAKEIRLIVDEAAFLFSYFGTGVPLTAEELLKIVKILGFTPEYVEKTYDHIIMVTNKQIPGEKIEALSKTLGISVKVIEPKSFENLIVGLLDENFNIIALGIIKKFDPHERMLKIYTRADPEKIKIVAFGRIKIDSNFEEIGWIEPWSL